MKKNILKTKWFIKLKESKYINVYVIIITIILCGSIIIYFRGNNNQKINIIKKERQELKETQNVEKSDVDIPNKYEDFKQAFEKNEETVGWIYIPGTTVNWPVMKGIDNDYYLRKNEEKKYSFEGCIFADNYSVFDPIDKLSNNVVIYGHNLDDNPNGKRFAQLIKFQDMEFAQNTPYIFLTTKDASLIYEIYAVFFTDIKFGYINVELDEKMQQAMIDSAKQRSEYIYDVNVTGKDKVITLSTCTYKYGAYGSKGQKNTRFVIQGKLLKDVSDLKEKITLTKNINPKLPDLT